MTRRKGLKSRRPWLAALIGGALAGGTLLAWPVHAMPAGTTNAPPAVTTASKSPKTLRWSADPRKGIREFSSVQCDAKTFGTTTDRSKGRVWQVRQPAHLERCEGVGPTVTAGSTYYLGWSSKFHITDSTSRYLFQLKCSPSVGTANHPIVLVVTHGHIELQEWTHKHKKVVLWRTKAVNDRWNSYVLKVYGHRTKGTIRFWFNGAPQKLSNGSYTFTGTTYDGTRDYLKWGIYHTAPATATHWLSTIKMGTSLADVKS
ncbi:heparin lyase I family protein [Streptomyces sp. NPDC047515]|uniref:heparin lyase I family protein n=1 Tax=Streptomyces sp. NPDC047515 TaxID=3155380 RepID=UPI00341170D6